MKKLLPILVVSLLIPVAIACGDDDGKTSAATATPAVGTEGAAAGDPTPNTEPFTLRLGYFANITHSQPLVGLKKGIFPEE